jgi:predicted nuclease of predicted toxin-antitoxin system
VESLPSFRLVTLRLLLDENFPKPAIDALQQAAHDVIWIRTHSPGISDNDILQLAARDHRIVLTLDKDFRQISLQQPNPSGTHGVILFRIHPALPEKVIAVAIKTLEFTLDWYGHFTVVTETEIQTIRFPNLKV